jgi:hypothetical protein
MTACACGWHKTARRSAEPSLCVSETTKILMTALQILHIPGLSFI